MKPGITTLLPVLIIAVYSVACSITPQPKETLTPRYLRARKIYSAPVAAMPSQKLDIIYLDTPLEVPNASCD